MNAIARLEELRHDRLALTDRMTEISDKARPRAGIFIRMRRRSSRSSELYALPFFRGRRLSDIEPPDVRAFVSSMEGKGKAPSTIRKALAPMRAMFATAVEDGHPQRR